MGGEKVLAILLEVATAPATQAGAVDFSWLFIKMMGALFVVCLLAVVILKYAVPKVGLLKRFAGSQYIEIIARQNLEQRKHLYLVKIGPRYALVGASDHGVNLVMELSKEDVESRKEIKQSSG